jgi:hypothetical protein
MITAFRCTVMFMRSIMALQMRIQAWVERVLYELEKADDE